MEGVVGMFGFLKSKNKVEPPKEQVKSGNKLLETMREQYSFAFKGDVTEQEFFKNTSENIKRRVLPIDIKDYQVAAYSRHKGNDIGFYLTNDNGLGFYIIKEIPIRVFASIIRKKETHNHLDVLSEELRKLFEVEVISFEDFPYFKTITDTYFQKYLLLMASIMENGDRIILNRNGLSIEFKSKLGDKELTLIMSFLHLVCENFKKTE